MLPVKYNNHGQTITIQNIRIDFPVKPYPAQIQIMTKIINALNKKENALLESPTGSGKSLALLCAVLAWRENQEKLVVEQILNSKKSMDELPKKQKKTDIKTNKKDKVENNNIKHATDDDDFQQPLVKRFIGQMIEKEEVEEEEIIEIQEEDIKALKYSTYKQVPRIFVGSRTHKQITQLVHELKHKTRYKPRTTVLGSREHLCIHPKVKTSTNKADDCTELLDKDKCSYGLKSHKILSHSSLKNSNRVWDIEDIVKIGNKTKGCPYFAARKLYEGAEVIFCPYNYIIDPVIRKILDINLKESIVILDEAHNIEDASRSAGSYELSEQALDTLLKELSDVAKYGGEPAAHKNLELVLEQLWNLMTSDNTNYTSKEYEQYSCHFTGQDLLNKLSEINITKHTYKEALLPDYRKVSEYAEMIRKELEDRTIEKDTDNQPEDAGVKIHRVKCLSNGSLTVLQGIFLVLGYLCDPNHNYASDYEMVFMKTIDRQNTTNKKRKTNLRMPRNLWKHKLAFWCLNPGIIFRNMCETTHSVILASGTLSPLNTFASELGTEFVGKLEANHVIKPSQVWVNAIPYGPTGKVLKGIYSNIESFEYQDEIGKTLCQVVETIPFGVLCFMPSYKTVDIMIERWKAIGLLDRIQKKKLVLIEPRGSDKKEFENILDQFYKKIQQIECGVYQNDEQDGAIMFAVFRGKISEGIDFSDNYCRAVVTLGIPYPGVKDLEVNLKRDYNNRLKGQHKNVLSGGEWYSAQAFRAINQALGRCIRHKNDWGAIILLEERFNRPENVSGLSKWIKGQLHVESNFEVAMSSLKQFIQDQLKYMEKMKSEEIPVGNSALNPIGIDTIPLKRKLSFKDNDNIQHKVNFIDLEENSSPIETLLIDDSLIIDMDTLKQLDDAIHMNKLADNSLQTSENEIHLLQEQQDMIIDSVQQFHEQPHNTSSQSAYYTKLLCRLCQFELLQGPGMYIKPTIIKDLSCISGGEEQVLVMELKKPGFWEMSDRFIGGPLDIDHLPVSSDVIYNRKDEICYKLLACQCNNQQAIGILVCIAVSEKKNHHVGKVYLIDEKLKRIAPVLTTTLSQEDLEAEIPNSQYSSVDDIFYNL